MSPVILDIVVALLVVGYAIAGFRTGFVVTATALIGFVGGAFAGLATMPRIVDAAGAGDEPALTRAVLVIGGTVALAVLGQALAGLVGTRLVRLVHGHPVSRGIDGALGGVAAFVVTLVMVWGVAGSLRPIMPPSWSRTLAETRTMSVIDGLMPQPASNVLATVRAQTGADVFPRVFGGLSAEPIRPVDPPDPDVPHTPGLERARGSIVRIVAEAGRCGRIEKGSGWVAAPGRVVTNAHVVAGSNAVTVSSAGTGRLRDATVVLLDPKLDLAVLSVPGLPVPPLQTAGDLPRDAAAVVAGFPLGGAYTLGSARVRGVLQATGADIYDAGRVERSVYSLYATVRPGNSGGPLLDDDGRVVGTIFARSLDDPKTGYALTMAQSRTTIAKGLAASGPVATGRCTKS